MNKKVIPETSKHLTDSAGDLMVSIPPHPTAASSNNDSSSFNATTTNGLQMFSAAQLRTLFIGVPFFTKWLLLCVVLVSLISILFPVMSTIFGLVPGFTLSTPYYFWNVFTAGFFEDSIVSLLICSLLLLIYGKHLESVWGSYEFGKFVIVTNIGVGVSTCFVVVMTYGVTGDETLIYSQHWCGLSGLLLGCAVASKQLNPDLEFGYVPLRAKQLPGLIVALLLAMGALGIISGLKYIPFPLFGLLYSWIYLRFFQVRSGNSKGDFSEGFAFATFFPEMLQTPVSIVCNLIYNILRLCCPCFRSSEGQRQVHTFIDPSAVSLADPADAERRRQRALRALDTRIAQIKEGEVKSHTIEVKPGEVQT